MNFKVNHMSAGLCSEVHTGFNIVIGFNFTWCISIKGEVAGKPLLPAVKHRLMSVFARLIT